MRGSPRSEKNHESEQKSDDNPELFPISWRDIKIFHDDRIRGHQRQKFIHCPSNPYREKIAAGFRTRNLMSARARFQYTKLCHQHESENRYKDYI